MSNMKITAEQIKEGRDKRQITQAELAAEIGVSMRTIGSWERGDSVPRNKVPALMEALSLEPAGEYQWDVQAVRSRVGQLAKQRREELGLSREAMAERAGLRSPQTVQNFEFARSMPHTSTLRSFEQTLEWKVGSIDDALESGRRAGDLRMEDFDKFDRTETRPLSSFSTQELLEELIPRLEGIKGALGPSRSVTQTATDHQFLYGLAANTDPSHLERMAEDEKQD